MLIKRNNLTIRNATLQDAEILAKWWNDGAIMAHAGFPNGTGEKAADIAAKISQDTDETYRRHIIELDNVPIGEMNYRNKGNGIAEIGIKICDPSKRENGNGTLLLSMFIHSLFEDLKYDKITLDTNMNNTRAQHVYEKLGFRKLRVNINSWKNQVGEVQSSIDYEMTKDDFINFAK